MKHWMTLAIVLAMSGVAMAAEGSEPVITAIPVVPTETVWAGVMVQVIIGLFISAAAIGPLVSILSPPAPEPEPSHDDHGHDDHGHGHDAHGAHGAHGH